MRCKGRKERCEKKTINRHILQLPFSKEVTESAEFSLMVQIIPSTTKNLSAKKENLLLVKASYIDNDTFLRQLKLKALANIKEKDRTVTN